MKIILIGLLLCISNILEGQTLAEWTRQKKTQKKYLLQQIAALRTYLGYAEKGYAIVNKGLTTIGNIKKGDFSLHHDFFDHLGTANPVIKNSAKVAGIISYQQQIIILVRQSKQRLHESTQYNKDEINYCSAVFDRLLNDCLKSMDELVLVLTASQMSDDERILRIEKIHQNMMEQYTFTASFSEELRLLSLQRTHEAADINQTQKINGLR